MKVHAVDFDGTLCEDRWPEIGPPITRNVEYFIAARASGDKLILWTCREGKLLEDAVMWCAQHGLVFDAVNKNLPERMAIWGNNPRKVGADYYWDDKSMKPEDIRV